MKYGRSKYNRGKYGRYELPTDQGGALAQDVRYRIKSVSGIIESPYIINQSVSFPTNSKPTAIRIRSNLSGYITHMEESLPGDVYRIRIKAISPGNESSWVESVVGTIRKVEQ